jgi:hypothetical protein
MYGIAVTNHPTDGVELTREKAKAAFKAAWEEVQAARAGRLSIPRGAIIRVCSTTTQHA